MPEEQKVTRKLSAILSADVKGYSILMADDEVHTIETLKSHRQIISNLINEHTGRVVDSPGDNILAEFRSVVDAVNCAVKIQRKLEQENSKFVDEKKVQFRIGVNIGDVIQDGDRIYGNGVNVAARIEGLAEPGGVCISRNAYDHTRDKLDLGYEYLGEHSVKNIKQPVRVYKVLMDPKDAGKLIGVKAKPLAKSWIWPLAAVVVILLGIVTWQYYQKITTPEHEPASIEKMAFPLPNKPSIAVLPFDNMSGNPEDDYIADGITEDIITAISKIDAMFVIARNSTFTYKGKPVKVKQISEEFGVQYVLEGSIQRSGDRLRVTSQLIDALTGYHLWSDRYDREMQELFDIKDEITKKIVTELSVEITDGEQARLWAEQTDNFEAWIQFRKGLSFLANWEKKENTAKAKAHFEQAVQFDPEFASAWAALSQTHYIDWNSNWSKNREKSYERYVELARKAISFDKSSPLAHALLCFMYSRQGKYEEAIAEITTAIDLSPNNATLHHEMSRTMHFAGRPEEAIESMKKAMRLHPAYPAIYLVHKGHSLHYAGRYEEALSAYEQYVERKRQIDEQIKWWIHFGFTAAYLELNEIVKASEHYKKALASNKTKQDFIVWAKTYAGYTGYKDKDLDHLMRLFEPLREMYADSVKKVQYVYKATPAFKFEYPEGSKKTHTRRPTEVLKMLPPSDIELNAYVTDIPEGITTTDIGLKYYLPLLKEAGVGTKFKVISNQLIALGDGTKACRTEIEWKNTTLNVGINTLLVAAYRENKLVYLTTHSAGDPEIVAWVVESLTFEDKETMLKLPEKPSIAVLPFDNLSDDKEQEYFSDGMTDDIITDLSKIKDLLVISRNSAFTYKGKDKKIPEIAKELNVKYILEGSVRRAGDQVRINAQLIDAETDHHVWAERFDDTSQNIFELQDRITKKIVSELALKLSPDEVNRIASKGTDSTIAHDMYLKGQAHLRRWTPEDLVKAIDYFKQAVEVDPHYSQAYVGLSQAYLNIIVGGKAFILKTGYRISSARYLMRHYVELAMKKPIPGAYYILASLEKNRRHYDESINLAGKAVALAPNDADALRMLGTVLMYDDRPEEGIQYLKEAIRLNPLEGNFLLGLAYMSMQKYKKAIEAAQHSLVINPLLLHAHIVTAVSYAHLGSEEEAKLEFNKYLEIYADGYYPELEFLHFNYPFKNHEVFNRFIEGLEKAGFIKGAKGYYEVNEANKLNGQEIKELLFGKTATGYRWGYEFFVQRSEEGVTEVNIPIRDILFTGESWVEGDTLCQRYENRYEGVKYCCDIYYNPNGTANERNQYLIFGDAAIVPISIKE